MDGSNYINENWLSIPIKHEATETRWKAKAALRQTF